MVASVLLILYCVSVAVFGVVGVICAMFGAAFAGDSIPYNWPMALRSAVWGLVLLPFFWPITIPATVLYNRYSDKRFMRRFEARKQAAAANEAVAKTL